MNILILGGTGAMGYYLTSLLNKVGGGKCVLHFKIIL